MTVLLGLALAAASTAPIPNDAQLDAAFAPWSGTQVPGCAVGIARPGHQPVLRAYGMADLEHPTAITPDTIFESGSVAKQFTAAAVLILVEEGRLRLEDDVRRYLPDLPDYGDVITIDQLLTHTSGLRDWSDLADFTGWPRYSRAYSNADALALLARQRALNHRPGTAFSYTNSGYNLLAIIVERVSGETLAAFTRKRLFAPLGMARSSWRDDYRRIVPGRAIGYVRSDDVLVAGAPMENAHGSGGMLTTIGDLLRWEMALSSQRLGPFVTAKLVEPTQLNGGGGASYGRGLMLSRFQGTAEIYHNGGTNGYQAWAGRYPDHGLAIALLCNGRTVGPDTQARRVARLFLPEAPARPEEMRAPSAERLVRRGRYVGSGPYQLLDIKSDEEGLKLASGATLAYIGPGRYRLGEGELRFLGADKAERRLADGTIIPLERKAPVVPTAKTLAALTGRYASKEVEATLTIAVEQDGIRVTINGRAEVSRELKPVFADGYAGDGILMQVVRNRVGKVTGLRFKTSRVYALAFTRVPAP